MHARWYEYLGSKDLLKHSLHLSTMFPSFLCKARFWSLMDLAVLGLFLVDYEQNTSLACL